MSNAEQIPNEETTTNNSNKIDGVGILEIDINKFSPYRLLEAFKGSIVYDDANQPIDVTVKDYVVAYEEILKFLDYLGAIFYFVVVDVKDKIVRLHNFLKENPNNYETILKTVKYEQENNIHATLRLNASRTILRLHRALLFIYKFLEVLVADHKNSSPTTSSTSCVEVYEKTLGLHHTWIIRKAATLGMLTLPRREVLVQYMCPKSEDLEHFPMFIKYVDTVYNLTQNIYEKYKLLELP